MDIDAIFFDLDDTVYPRSSGVWPMIGQRISQYIHERLNIDWEDIPAMRRSLFETYGTTGRGLKARYDIDEQEYLHFVHDIPVEEVLKPDIALREMLLSLSQRRIIFTNANQGHARRVTQAIQIGDCFEKIIDINMIAPTCKPFPEAYQKALSYAGISDPSTCLVVDDAPANLRSARNLGCRTVLIMNEGDHPGCETRIANLIDLPQAIRCLSKGNP